MTVEADRVATNFDEVSSRKLGAGHGRCRTATLFKRYAPGARRLDAHRERFR